MHIKFKSQRINLRYIIWLQQTITEYVLSFEDEFNDFRDIHYTVQAKNCLLPASMETTVTRTTTVIMYRLRKEVFGKRCEPTFLYTCQRISDNETI